MSSFISKGFPSVVREGLLTLWVSDCCFSTICMHVCMCMYVCMYVCIYVCMYVCMCAYMHTNTLFVLHLDPGRGRPGGVLRKSDILHVMCIYIYIYIYTYTYMYTYMYIYTHIYYYLYYYYVYMYIYIYIYKQNV